MEKIINNKFINKMSRNDRIKYYKYSEINNNKLEKYKYNFNDLSFNFLEKMINYKSVINDLSDKEIEINNNKRKKINFIITNMKIINLDGGYVSNEIKVMTFLTKIFEIYYNDNYINDCIENDYLNINKLNKKIDIRLKKSNKNEYYENYEGIFKGTNNYDLTFFRADIGHKLYDLFKKIEGKKIYSHGYNKNIWENEIIGMQTFVSEYMLKNNLLNKLKDDGTLNYKNIDIIPNNIITRPNFIYKYTNNNNKIEKKEIYKICLIGNIQYINTILNNLNEIFINIIKKINKKINIIILSKNKLNINQFNFNNIYKNYLEISTNYYNDLNEYYNFLSTCDLAINTCNSQVSYYSNSNKVLDCITVDIPIIVPHSFHLYEILGEDYKLYYRINNYKEDLEELILYRFNNKVKYNINITKYNNKILNYYNNLLNKYDIYDYNKLIKYEFDLPKRIDNEIRLIYCGILCEEYNILEIIDEFQKIHKERPEVLLKIVYGKIHGNKEFTEKVNKYIKNGVKGIIFKHNLSHKDACYEIATSDIGICWRKNGWGDNGEVSTKVKEYEMYGLEIMNNINLINEECKNKKKINIKFGEKYTPVKKYFLTNIEYDFTYENITTNTLTKIYLFKNVFYKIICENTHNVVLYNENNLKDNIFRNCLHGKKNTYFIVKNNGLYYIIINTKNKNEIINIENYISLNYICGDNIFMLNLNHQKDKFTINEMILNKMGIMINRFEAINGYDKKYDKLWNKISNTPFSDLEKKLGRKLIVSRGSMGYLLSMEKIFSNIKNSYLCVFDDDILINKKMNIEKLTKILVNFSDFNILKFGSSQWNWDNIKINNNFYYSNDLSNGSFACIYNPRTITDILKQIRNFNEPFDFSPLRQFINKKSYVLYPNEFIANLSDVSTITNKTRDADYKRFKWNLSDYIKLPYISNKKSLINNNINKNLHFIIGIITFKRIIYLKELINSMITTLTSNYFFTIIISKGLDLLESEHVELEEFLINSFKKFDNINLIINYSYLHYNYHTCNSILKLSENIEYDFGFILNDDILVYDDWYIKYYNSSKANNIEHLCWLQDKETTIIDENKNLKHKGDVFNANGVLLTFTKNLIKNVGFFNETDFKVRGQAHIEWSLRCCNKGYNNKYNFYDIINSNEIIKLNINEYTSAISNSIYLDKTIHFVDKDELERRNKILYDLYQI